MAVGLRGLREYLDDSAVHAHGAVEGDLALLLRDELNDVLAGRELLRNTEGWHPSSRKRRNGP